MVTPSWKSRAVFVSTRRAAGAVCLVACAVLLIGCVEPPNTNEGTHPTGHAAPGYLHVETADELVTVLARDVSLKDILAEVARQNGLVLVLHDPLDEHVTLELRRLPLSQALGRMLRDRSLLWQSGQTSSGASNPRKTYPGRLWVFSKGQRDAAEIAFSNPALLDERAKVRLDAVSALADAGGDQAVATLTAIALSDGDSAVREEAVDALGDIGGTTGIQGLEQALTDPDYHVREAAVEALADTGGDASALALTAALEDRNVSLREEAVDALGEIGGPTAVRLLRLAAKDEHSAVREAAAEYLAELSNHGL